MKNVLRLSIALLILVTSCKNDTKENETVVEDTKEETTKDSKETINVPEKVVRDKKVTVDLNPKNDSSASGKVIFSEKDGVVSMLASIKGLPEGEHAISIRDKGEVGNFTVEKNGRGTATMTTDEWCIGCGDDAKDIIGKVVMVHQGGDQPSDSSISCQGIIE